MKHLSLTELTDYVRGLSPNEAPDILVHVNGCPSCASTVDLLARAFESAAADRYFEAPAELVAAAEGIFPREIAVKREMWAGLRRVVAQLSWNSADAVPVGVRSLSPDARHFVYRAGRYCIDLVLDSDPSASAITMTGQIADESAPGHSIDNARALLLSGTKIIASANTNAFGEFSLRYRTSRNLHLFVPVAHNGEYVDLSLEGPG